jgi:hypothetical protein
MGGGMGISTIGVFVLYFKKIIRKMKKKDI